MGARSIAIVMLGLFCAVTYAGVDMERVSEIANMLSERPEGLGTPISDRKAWAGLRAEFGPLVSQAEGLLKAPVPEQSDELYLDFSKTGNRDRWQRVAFGRRGCIRTLVLAECVENRGRFLPKIEEYVEALCAERTWVYPAHDRDLNNFHRKIVEIDLGSSGLAWELATADHLLGEKLTLKTRDLLRTNLVDRIIVPMRDMLNGKQARGWWLAGNNNWNAVCLANVTGTAMAIVESREDRAFFVAAAESLIMNFLKGFTPDGYCSEGVGYWNYGFGHFVMLTETIYQSTGGKLDLLTIKAAREPALFGARIQIVNGISPSFADCSPDARPSPAILRYVSLRLGLGLREYEKSSAPLYVTKNLYGSMLSSVTDSASKVKSAETSVEVGGLRSWFPDAGVLVCRPADHAASMLGVALKGGHNGEHHNHNDVGSYLIVTGKGVPVTDPGAEVYTARTFSGKRYESRVLNSFGHSVPVVGGRLQEQGSSSRGKVLENSFATDEDMVEFEIKSAYRVPALTSLKRRFTYDRRGVGAFTVRDDITLSKAERFENAIITFGTWTRLDAHKLLIQDGDSVLEVTLAPTPDVVLNITSSEIKEDLRVRRTLTRIAIAFPQAVTNAVLELQYRPMSSPNPVPKEPGNRT